MEVDIDRVEDEAMTLDEMENAPEHDMVDDDDETMGTHDDDHPGIVDDEELPIDHDEVFMDQGVEEEIDMEAEPAEVAAAVFESVEAVEQENPMDTLPATPVDAHSVHPPPVEASAAPLAPSDPGGQPIVSPLGAVDPQPAVDPPTPNPRGDITQPEAGGEHTEEGYEHAEQEYDEDVEYEEEDARAEEHEEETGGQAEAEAGSSGEGAHEEQQQPTPAVAEIDGIQAVVAGEVTEEVAEGEEEEYYEEADGSMDDSDEGYPADVHSLPPIILRLPSLGARALFNALPEGDLPIWLKGRAEDLGDASLDRVWAAIKEEMTHEQLAQHGEMVITEKEMDLKMGEVGIEKVCKVSSTNRRTTSISNLSPCLNSYRFITDVACHNLSN